MNWWKLIGNHRTDGNNMLIEYLWKTVHSSHILGWYTHRHACKEDEKVNKLMQMLKIEDFLSIYHTRNLGERWHPKYIRFFMTRVCLLYCVLHAEWIFKLCVVIHAHRHTKYTVFHLHRNRTKTNLIPFNPINLVMRTQLLQPDGTCKCVSFKIISILIADSRDKKKHIHTQTQTELVVANVISLSSCKFMWQLLGDFAIG